MCELLKSMLRAWCLYRNMEYVEGYVTPLPSDNFENGYLMGYAEATGCQWYKTAEKFSLSKFCIARTVTERGREALCLAECRGDKFYDMNGSLIETPNYFTPVE